MTLADLGLGISVAPLGYREWMMRAVPSGFRDWLSRADRLPLSGSIFIDLEFQYWELSAEMRWTKIDV